MSLIFLCRVVYNMMEQNAQSMQCKHKWLLCVVYGTS